MSRTFTFGPVRSSLRLALLVDTAFPGLKHALRKSGMPKLKVLECLTASHCCSNRPPPSHVGGGAGSVPSRLGTSLKPEDDLKRRPSNFPELRPLQSLRRLLSYPSVTKPYISSLSLSILLLLSIFFILRSVLSSDGSYKRQYDGSRGQADYVALGKARAAMLAATPRQYAEIGDRWLGGGGPFHRGRTSIELSKTKILELEAAGRSASSSFGRDIEFESHRHGILGGSSTEW